MLDRLQIEKEHGPQAKNETRRLAYQKGMRILKFNRIFAFIAFSYWA